MGNLFDSEQSLITLETREYRTPSTSSSSYQSHTGEQSTVFHGSIACCLERKKSDLFWDLHSTERRCLFTVDVLSQSPVNSTVWISVGGFAHGLQSRENSCHFPVELNLVAFGHIKIFSPSTQCTSIVRSSWFTISTCPTAQQVRSRHQDHELQNRLQSHRKFVHKLPQFRLTKASSFSRTLFRLAWV
jgi:hypothetical protein